MDTGVGGILREARNRRKLDLSEVEGAIKIRLRYLLAMENEEWDVLPGGTYTRGFIRTYASYLGLDGDRLAEDYRNAAASAERPSRGEPVLGSGTGHGSGRRMRGRAIGVLLIGGLVAAMVVIGLLSGGGSGPGPTATRHVARPTRHATTAPPETGRPAQVAVSLTANAEVWVCLIDGDGRHPIDGRILEAGAEEGPYRSDRFELSLGNGQVVLAVNGKNVSLPESGSPMGYRIDSSGRLKPMGESERPTCT